MEALDLDNILDPESAEHLFDPDYSGEDTKEEPEAASTDKTENKDDTAEEIDGESIFSSESVGSEDKEDEADEDTADDDGGSSPSNFYSSIARAAKEDGIFADLDDETIDKISNAEDFGKALDKQVQSMLDAKQKRIDSALTAGVPDNVIQGYERTLDYLDSIDEKKISEESEAGQTLCRQLIYQDFINRGFSKERANREVQKSFSAGTEIDDAKAALQGNKDFFTEKYNSIIEEQEQERQNAVKEQEKAQKELEREILEGADIFEGLKLDKATRRKVFDSISAPFAKDPDTGMILTEIQKYERDNRKDFIKKIGLLYVMTDKFTKLDNLIGKQVNKEVKKGLRNLERTLNTTSRDSDGNLRLMTGGGKSDKESYSGYEIDI
jgi:hypothetical protein